MPDADTLVVAGSYGVPGMPSDAVVDWLRDMRAPHERIVFVNAAVETITG